MPHAYGAVGDLAVFAPIYLTTSITITAVSGTKSGAWIRRARESDATDASTTDIWTAKATLTNAADVLTITYSGSTTGVTATYWGDSYTAGLGANTFWQVPASGTTRTGAATTFTYASLTSATTSNPQAYVGFGDSGSFCAGGSTSGFSYIDSPTNTGTEEVYNLSLASNTAYAPGSTNTGAGYNTTTAIIIEASLVTSSDTLFISESVSRATATRIRAVSDTLFSSESVSRAVSTRSRASSDTLFVSESASRSAATKSRAASDTLLISESSSNPGVVRSRISSDTLFISESVSRSVSTNTRANSDTVFSSESASRTVVNFSRAASDTVFSSESASRSIISASRTASDTVFISEAVSRSGVVHPRTSSDTLFSGESVSFLFIPAVEYRAVGTVGVVTGTVATAGDVTIATSTAGPVTVAKVS